MLGKRYRNDGESILPLNEVQKKACDQVRAAIEKNEYVFEEVLCVICGGKNYELLAEKDRYGLYAPVVLCKDCGLVQSNPRMDQNSFNDFYNNLYRPLYVGTEKLTSDFFLERYDLGKEVYKFLTQQTNLKEKNILDVGCGSGGILKYFIDAGIKKGTGIDLGAEYLRYGIENFGLNLLNQTIYDIRDEKYDLIMYSDVFEHILDPNKELSQLRNLLSPDGLLYLGVPGIYHVIPAYRDFLRYLQNAHVYHYTLRSLQNLMEKNGFDLVYGDEVVRSLWKKSTQNNPQNIHNDYEPCIGYLRKCEQIRIPKLITQKIKFW